MRKAEGMMAGFPMRDVCFSSPARRRWETTSQLIVPEKVSCQTGLVVPLLSCVLSRMLARARAFEELELRHKPETHLFVERV